MSLVGAIPMLGGLSLRFATSSDENFLLDMFLAARPWLAETSPDRDFVRFLLEDQKRIARLGAETVYPAHLEFIVEKTGQAVGHLLVDLGYADWRISQLEIHPQARGKSIGGDIMRSLQKAADGKNIALTVSTVMTLPRALGFYLRLGFVVTRQQAPVVDLIWLPMALRAKPGEQASPPGLVGFS